MENLLVQLAALGSIFGWAFFSFWSSIPAGIALSVSPVLVALTATFSYGSGAALVVLAGAPLRERIRRRMENHASDGDNIGEAPPKRRMIIIVENAWQRYGLIGLAILAPMTVGSQIGAVIGLGFGAKPVPLVVALTLGALGWAVLIAGAVVLGVTTVT